jgi:hypothetical protein
MDKSQLLERLKEKEMPSREKLISWVQCLPGSSSSKKPKRNKVGDVYMHPIFQHPYILLEKRDGHWLCGLMTSESKCPEILENVKSRFFDGFITKTLFTATEVIGSFINTYDNTRHLKLVREKLKTLFS